jgi:hypothetical protein
MKTTLLLFILVSTVSCGFAPYRSYLTEMEQDDSTYFQPRDDFQVVPGDTGRDYRSAREWQRRIPASETTRFREREQSSLNEELAQLESSQSEGAFNHYKQHRSQLGSVSERIYFLQLASRAEREEYLEARGFSNQAQKILPQERLWATSTSEVVMGMTKEDVEASWGRPQRVDVAGNPRNENERWQYNRDGAVKYIFFEGGAVEGWTNGR